MAEALQSVSPNVTAQEEKVWALLGGVLDPEIPVLTILDLGIVRGVSVDEGSSPPMARVDFTPTYCGCPAIDAIGMAMRIVLEVAGFAVELRQVLSPAWTTDWMSDAGREKLKAYGIAPPMGEGGDKASLTGAARSQNPKYLQCPQCGSRDTQLVSAFGSTACKSLHRCNRCGEPFDHFKCH